MKVKYPKQVALVKKVDPGVSTGVDYIDLSDNFPVLAAGDAIMVRKVTLSLDIESIDILHESIMEAPPT